MFESFKKRAEQAKKDERTMTPYERQSLQVLRGININVAIISLYIIYHTFMK